MRISDWSSDVCSSDLLSSSPRLSPGACPCDFLWRMGWWSGSGEPSVGSGGTDCSDHQTWWPVGHPSGGVSFLAFTGGRSGRCRSLRLSRRVPKAGAVKLRRSEEHTSELQSLMRISYAVFLLQKKNNNR